ncbi:glycosyltransferase family 4 protein [Pontibacter fetidus]|uniref:Glycosyltransferase n=1 Tax=Pontibacter fetidus TaxID=2700082 RepID=A0A6B2GZM3_9BACT|nr:glycosyltransferase family 4 protein [Pontibacter fetidus]NDK56315.1 glycosyltransferase [Pontibacter fetidus]
MPKEILFITPDPPVPPSGGGRRSYHLLKAAAKAGIVDLVVLWRLSSEAKSLLNNFVRNILHVKQNQYGTKKTILRKIATLVGILLPLILSDYEFNYLINYVFVKEKLTHRAISFWLINWYRLLIKLSLINTVLPARSYERYLNFQLIKPELQKLVNSKTYDLVIIDFSYIGSLVFPVIKNIPFKIVNTHNIESQFYKQLLSESDIHSQKYRHKLNLDLMKQVEIETINNADLVFTCSLIDKKKFLELASNANIKVVPNGVDINFFKAVSLSKDDVVDKIILFTGDMGYKPNIDAVIYFARQILPDLLLQIPSICFVIAGRNAASTTKYINLNLPVKIIDSPEDMRPVYNSADLCVVPLRYGSGTRLKILEAWAMNKAVVSTTIGAEGLDVNVSNITLADTPEEFINACLAVLSDKELKVKLGSEGRKTIETSYNWKQIESDVKTMLQEIK